MKKNRLAIAAAATAAALATPPALAVSSASATLSPISITLYDLNTSDGITPWITFNAGSESKVFARADDYQAGLNSYNGASGTFGWDPVSASAAVPNASGAASVAGDGSPSGTVLSASGSALGVNPLGAFSEYYAVAIAPQQFYSEFTLSANTLVVMSASSSLTTEVTASFDPGLTDEWEHASADTVIELSGAGPLGTGGQVSNDRALIYVYLTYYDDAGCTYGYCDGPASAASSSTLTVSFVNASSGDLTGGMYAQASVTGYSYAQAVPEPGSVALMLAGLAALGFVGRRRA